MKKILLAILLMAPLSMFAQKFAHCNVSDIIPNMKEYTAAQTEIENLYKQYGDELKRMQEELQKKYEEYQKEADKLLPNVKQRRETEIQNLQQSIQQAAQENEQTLAKVQQEKLQAIQDLVLAAVKKVGEAGGYIYVFDISGGAIPYVSTSLSTDVTPDVKKALGI